METQTPFILKVVGAITAALGASFGLGKCYTNIVKKKELYQDDGQQIYLTVSKSKENTEDCRNAMSDKFTSIESKLDSISTVIAAQNEKDVVNARLAGAFEQYMKDHPK